MTADHETATQVTPPAVFARHGIITLLVTVLTAMALDDITTDSATAFVLEYSILAAAGGWGVFVGYNLLRTGHGVVGTTSVILLAAAAWVAVDGLGHKRDGGWSAFWPEYTVMLATSVWFVALSVILLALSRMALRPERVTRR